MADIAAFPKFSDLDTNTDKSLTFNELKDAVGNIDTSQWDLNGDGVIKANEYNKGINGLKALDKLDKDGDGILTETETGNKWKNLSKLDANGDGKISTDEYLSKTMKKSKPAFAAVDTDKSGDVSAAELTAKFGTMDYTKWDMNKDGKIGKGEYSAGADGAMKFTALDLNRDGFLTGAEVSAAKITKLDTNKDGKLDRDEYVPQFIKAAKAAATAAAGTAGTAGTAAAANAKPQTKRKTGLTDADWEAWRIENGLPDTWVHP